MYSHFWNQIEVYELLKGKKRNDMENNYKMERGDGAKIYMKDGGEVSVRIIYREIYQM